MNILGNRIRVLNFLFFCFWNSVSAFWHSFWCSQSFHGRWVPFVSGIWCTCVLLLLLQFAYATHNTYRVPTHIHRLLTAVNDTIFSLFVLYKLIAKCYRLKSPHVNVPQNLTLSLSLSHWPCQSVHLIFTSPRVVLESVCDTHC